MLTWLLIMLALLVTWMFLHVLLEFVLRVAGFLLCIWLAMQAQHSVTELLGASELVGSAAAIAIAYIGVRAVTFFVLRWGVRLGKVEAMNDVKVIDFDIGRYGLGLVMIVSLLVILLSVAHGGPVAVPLIWLAVFSVAAAFVNMLFSLY